MAVTPVALITAGSAGLGAATARLFARNGMRVVVNYSSNAERANSLVKELSELSTLDPASGQVNFHAIKADMGQREDIKRLVEETVAQMGNLNVVFSNHGWTRVTGLEDLDENAVEEDWDRCFNMNVKSHLWLMQAARKHLEETEGSFITTASVAGVCHSGSSLAYSVTKAAQIHLVKGLAVMASPKVRVNSVAPSLLLTEWGARFSEEAQQANKAKTKLKRFTTVEDVAQQVLGLAQNNSMTGVNVVLDAGFTL